MLDLFSPQFLDFILIDSIILCTPWFIYQLWIFILTVHVKHFTDKIVVKR